MPTVEAEWRFDPDQWKLGPRVSVTLRNPRTGRALANLQAVFDTAEPYVLVHSVHVSRLVLALSVPKEGAELRLGGLVVHEPFREAVVQFQGKAIPEAHVRVVSFDMKAGDVGVDVVLGRELLRGRVLIYDGAHGVLGLIHDPPRLPASGCQVPGRDLSHARERRVE
jgi:hypothetical protein